MKLLKVFLCSLLLSTAAVAENIEISGVGVRRTVTVRAGDTLIIKGTSHVIEAQAEGGHARVNGTGNTLNCTGKWGTVYVNGTSNNLKVDAQADGIDVNGVGNHVTLVTKSGRATPSVTKNGLNNEVVTLP